MKVLVPDLRGIALVNLQKRYAVPSSSLRTFAGRLKRRLRLGKRGFTVCFVDDSAIRTLNLAYRGKDKATDVLSFPWEETPRPAASKPAQLSPSGEHVGIKDFLGDVVISVSAAERNAAMEGHSSVREMRWLILHGVLHLIGYDHERDDGEMMALELKLRDELEGGKRRVENRRSKIETRMPRLPSRRPA